MDSRPEIYFLTRLQMGDIQCYLSWSFLYLAPASKKLLVLVDHRPWTLKKHSRSTKLWQFMVTKYRRSPFINTRAFLNSTDHNNCSGSNGFSRSNSGVSEKLRKWYAVIDAAKWRKQYLLPVMDLTRALCGLLIFEVAWEDVHGINYMNELQTDTFFALEVKFMRKWEFQDPDHASRCISTWFSGTKPEMLALDRSLRKLSSLDIDTSNSYINSREILSSQSCSDELSRDMFYDAQEYPFEVDKSVNLTSSCKESVVHEDKMSMPKISSGVEASNPIPTPYAYTFILFRFSDAILPFKLRQIITSDLRLLRLLESGLPSWVIFFQSYPLFSNFYRPWMRHLARSLYIMISLITFIIGFYDLYKNIPPLRAAIARIHGPFFDWIEGCDMISRIQYLGTMLFLQNFEKAIKWFFMMVRATKPMLTMIGRPFAEPFKEIVEFISPFWDICVEIGEMLTSAFFLVIESLGNALLDLIEILIWPFERIYSVFYSLAMPVRTIFCSLWESLCMPFQLALSLVKQATKAVSNFYILLKNICKFLSDMLQVTSLPKERRGYHEISVWRGLWDDLFSQVFKALRSILNGLSAFFTACNRHRLSIYHHTQESFWRLAYVARLAPHRCSCTVGIRHDHLDECDRCKQKSC